MGARQGGRGGRLGTRGPGCGGGIAVCRIAQGEEEGHAGRREGAPCWLKRRAVGKGRRVCLVFSPPSAERPILAAPTLLLNPPRPHRLLSEEFGRTGWGGGGVGAAGGAPGGDARPRQTCPTAAGVGRRGAGRSAPCLLILVRLCGRRGAWRSAWRRRGGGLRCWAGRGSWAGPAWI